MSIPLHPAPPPPHQGNDSPPAKTNALAIAAFVSSFIVGMTGVVLGHIALHQIKTTREGGRWLAIAALVIGYSSTAIGVYFITAILSASG
ncbi:DUF4190 domain-containing protein [Paeniglutamicibacter sp. NPDC012692]|uniref:DUF4190 domain-containing protein n=1 Tax=Paeniglutamicibacter sp. NPDC012692 TaxID=3364388 RepID=UPI0036840FAA